MAPVSPDRRQHIDQIPLSIHTQSIAGYITSFHTHLLMGAAVEELEQRPSLYLPSVFPCVMKSQVFNTLVCQPERERERESQRVAVGETDGAWSKLLAFECVRLAREEKGGSRSHALLVTSL